MKLRELTMPVDGSANDIALGKTPSYSAPPICSHPAGGIHRHRLPASPTASTVPLLFRSSPNSGRVADTPSHVAAPSKVRASAPYEKQLNVGSQPPPAPAKYTV